ncbi:hypothetical protein FHW97_000654 [Novosphingobium sp. SG754]|uniref:hypothetical protein n=1 Tax=Novosphingobium sp. BK626 TaxID=2587088 RepID=UPI00181B4A6C|nr:hypothetical protein [Novosphingobium sp. BK626]MBB3476554.1 hypothetical protein [Novosphingobium sp. BK369]MBB3619215.1 hypothetical protein [Novosphingobium sp. BK592]NOX04182.1 hypothetical protein [Novosphingobium sp. SG754]
MSSSTASLAGSAPHHAHRKAPVNLRFIDWIWHVRGSLDLPAGQTGDEAFAKLQPLLRQPGTSQQRAADALRFSKVDPAAQDKLAVFENGVLQVEQGSAGLVLRYHLISRALLLCFLAPLLFLAFAQLTIAVGHWQKPAAEAAEKAKADKKKDASKDRVLPMNPIDKALGAPAPDKDGKKPDRKGDRYSPTSAYVFASFFAVLYVIGRILEAKLVKTRLRKQLLGE